MSVATPHRRPHNKSVADLNKILTHHHTVQMIARPAALILDQDIPDTGGYSVDGRQMFIDRLFLAMLSSREIAVPNMNADQVAQAILRHECAEKGIIDADNGIDDYMEAHEYATMAEHEYVRQFTTPRAYELAIHPGLEKVENKRLVKVPRNLACAPYLDEPDQNDNRVLKEMQGLGVVDASKLGKNSVKYSNGHAGSMCRLCKHYRPLPGQAPLAACDKVEGTVHPAKWCSQFAQEAA